MARETSPLIQIHRQIMWNRLIAVVEEQARIMNWSCILNHGKRGR